MAVSTVRRPFLGHYIEAAPPHSPRTRRSIKSSTRAQGSLTLSDIVRPSASTIAIANAPAAIAYACSTAIDTSLRSRQAPQLSPMPSRTLSIVYCQHRCQ